LSAFVSREARLLFLDVIFFHFNFPEDFFPLQSLYCSHAKQIRDLDELEYQAKATLPTAELFSTGK